MNEIEVKARLRDKRSVVEKLQKTGFFIEKKKTQRDTVFFPTDLSRAEDIERHHLGRNFLRIREEVKNGSTQVLFTLKQPRSNQTDCIEHEIEIQEKDIPTLSSLIQTLGYYEFVRVDKERETGRLEDMEVCLDEVKDLGSFIELEKFGPEQEAPRIQAELYAMLESWGIPKEDFVYDGYDILMHKSKTK